MWSLGILMLLPTAGPPVAEQWLLVVAPEYRRAAEPLIAQRRAQGMRVVVVSTLDHLTAKQVRGGEAGPLRAKIAQVARAWPGRTWVLLLGAVSSPFADRVVPTCRGTISRMKDQPTDAPYGCLGTGRLPTLAVGRMPARDESEARAMVAKTLALENAPPGEWKRRLTVLAGIPAFNPLVDRLVESVAFSRFDRIHPAWTGRALYTSSSSRFSVPEVLIRHRSLKYLREGQALTVYLGHSSPQGLWAGDAAFLDRDDFARLPMPHGGGVFLSLGCNACQLGGRDGEGYGLYAIRNPRGPAGVFGSHGVCFAAMANLAADALFEQALSGRLPARLGDCHLAALRGIAHGKMDIFTYRALDAVDGDPKIPQATQRQEHLEMFVLLGDPALRLPAVPEDIELTVPKPLKFGQPVTIRVRLPERLARGQYEIVLERTPASVPVGLEAVPGEGPARDRVRLANHERANNFQVARLTGTASTRDVEAKLTLGDSLPWKRLILRVRAWKGQEEALTARRLEIDQ